MSVSLAAQEFSGLTPAYWWLTVPGLWRNALSGHLRSSSLRYSIILRCPPTLPLPMGPSGRHLPSVIPSGRLRGPSSCGMYWVPSPSVVLCAPSVSVRLLATTIRCRRFTVNRGRLASFRKLFRGTENGTKHKVKA